MKKLGIFFVMLFALCSCVTYGSQKNGDFVKTELTAIVKHEVQNQETIFVVNDNSNNDVVFVVSNTTNLFGKTICKTSSGIINDVGDYFYKPSITFNNNDYLYLNGIPDIVVNEIYKHVVANKNNAVVNSIQNNRYNYLKIYSCNTILTKSCNYNIDKYWCYTI